MKLVIAVIQPDKLDEVREALIKADISRITITRVTGHGQVNPLTAVVVMSCMSHLRFHPSSDIESNCRRTTRFTCNP